MPGFRELAVEITGRRGLARVVPGDGSARDSEIEAARTVRIMGSWVHARGLLVRDHHLIVFSREVGLCQRIVNAR